MTTALIIVLVALLLAAWILSIANRLDRLHVRTDAAWAALDAALARRAVVTRALLDPELSAAASKAESATRAERELAENELSGLLGVVDRSTLPPALAAELSDAEERVMLARRVHNDAVRDTLLQRRRRMVRWLRLAGTAPQPSYFEIAEPAAPSAAVMLTPRPSARIVLTDTAGRVLLFQGFDPARPQELFWFTVGGGVEDGEELRDTAVREAFEETGVKLAPEQLVGPIWRRRAVFSFDGQTFDAEEWFFHASVDGEPAVDTSGFNDVEEHSISAYRWWTAEELESTDDTVYPVQLAELLPALTSEWDGQTRTVR
ncbi:NUDIX domain-containing protein [Lentzea sp. BCCO 10_0856]|uniref:NUDIX domain-containing protein n=1 Tax=Lentzea miocenica TaxID=3095431 RepID=A0ABU4TCA6_9PSEU|nr:NUDIX domain-containing protein [Lentzea sp. BCCO 10_0856]MDX8035809.1 NUDIX domain-containing protein [Lentzea sp. BCCO 10_0856]